MPVPLGRVAVSRTSTPLPDALPALRKSKFKVTFGRGQLCMIAGPPGGGKTTAALIMAINMGVPTLYFSADSDETTMAGRAASALTRHSYSAVRETQARGLYEEEYGEAVGKLPLRFVFDPSEPSMDDISKALQAHVELWGEHPHLIVIDNLMNMRSESGGNEWQEMRTTVKNLHWLARKTKACIWLLHHTSEGDSQWITSAPPRSAIQGKLAQLPELILTLANYEGYLYMAVVKNRHGASDPLAKEPLRMIINFDTNTLLDESASYGVMYGKA